MTANAILELSEKMVLSWKITLCPARASNAIHMYKSCKCPVSILYKSIAGRYRPIRVADGPITARYRFIKNASWEGFFFFIKECYSLSSLDIKCNIRAVNEESFNKECNSLSSYDSKYIICTVNEEFYQGR